VEGTPRPGDAVDAAALDARIRDALDGLLGAFELDALGADRFRVRAEPGRFDRIFGGQILAQALLAASATVAGKEPHSLHAYFVEAGVPEQPVDLAVDRVRDGRSFATRRVAVTQGERTVLIAMASFHTNPPGVEIAAPAPPAPAPHSVPSLQDWVLALPDDERPPAQLWVDRPPPVELRLGEPPRFLGGPAGESARSHWMRLPRGVGDDPLLHTALLAYASDYLLLDMVFRSHPEPLPPKGFTGFSLDHAIWFHRPVRFDGWHLHTQETMAVSGDRGLVRGSIHDEEGHLVATAVQEVLVRAAR
jgi:acyl-CoA thioesterase II